MDNLNDVANFAAILETKHGDLNHLDSGDKLNQIGLDGYTVVSTFTFNNNPYISAITVRDSAGNVYVHYFGTGDGNWGQNAAAYGAEPDPSDMQKKALDYFNETVQSSYEGQSAGKLYVTGHSQGGNSAQFVTIRSQYGDYIENCVSLDGPGFSHKSVEESKDTFGEAHYENQRNKIWAYNGENDFVSVLGQESIIKENQTRYIAYTGDGVNFPMFHDAAGLLDENGKISLVADDSQFRKFLIDIMNKIKDLDPSVQARAAVLAMKLCENLQGSVMVNITAQEFEEFKAILLPIIVEVLADDPDRLSTVLQELGMDKASADAIAEIIRHINTYPPEIRESIIASILAVIKYENGGITIDTSIIPAAIIAAWPIILETALTHPEDLMKLLHDLGIDKAIEQWIAENPWQFVGICIGALLLSPILIPIAVIAVLAGLLVDAIIRIVQGLTWLAGKIKDGIITIFNAIKNAINAVAQWIKDLFNVGRSYTQNHPYFEVDTAKLRDFAGRISKVNARLYNLDNNLHGLYWQVGLLDLWDILCANVLTSVSPTLSLIASSMNEIAAVFESAENNSYKNVGG